MNQSNRLKYRYHIQEGQKSLTALVQSELLSIKGSAEWSQSAAELDPDLSVLISLETAQVSPVPVSETLGPFRPARSFTIRIVICV